MINSANIKHQTSKFASLAMWLFIAVFMVTIQSSRAGDGDGIDTLRGDCSDCDVIELELEEAYLANERNETVEIVVDAMLNLYEANSDVILMNIADVLNCFDFCNDSLNPWDPNIDDCRDMCMSFTR